ncbi:hypothetical protein BDV93DRAFT_556922 [Ceratobasidium sp. AG-I]|nr:hypothetical protein BDV93DRAFT_556922 [Ceratobasidium sp. AG-I]
MEVCDRANQSEADAKDASKALNLDIESRHLSVQLAALWAIMMRNFPIYFIAHTASRECLGKIKEFTLIPATSSVVRDRLVEVVGASVF